MANITICGIGPGSLDYVLPAVHRSVVNSTILVGGKRQLALFDCSGKTVFEITGRYEELVGIVSNYQQELITILVSGDTGFHSLLKVFNREFKDIEIDVIPGISSYQYFFAKLKLTYENAYISSLHGQNIDFVDKFRDYSKIFLLTDERCSWKYIAQNLCDSGFGDCLMHVGNNLSYDNESIVTATASQFCNENFSFSLCSVIIERSINPIFSKVIVGLPDSCFVRDSVPMTKQEVRAVVLSKLQLTATDHLLDIGAGTGSVSIDAARILTAGKVTAVEKKDAALALIMENMRLFFVKNINIVAGIAPTALLGCSGVTAVFIGGSSGELPAILDWVASNTKSGTRVVITAITLNTLEFARSYFLASAFEVPEIIQVAVTRIEHIDSYDLMKANTPVWIFTTKLK